MGKRGSTGILEPDKSNCRNDISIVCQSKVLIVFPQLLLCGKIDLPAALERISKMQEVIPSLPYLFLYLLLFVFVTIDSRSNLRSLRKQQLYL